MLCVVASKDSRSLLGDFVNRVMCKAKLDSGCKKPPREGDWVMAQLERNLWLEEIRMIRSICLGRRLAATAYLAVLEGDY